MKCVSRLHANLYYGHTQKHVSKKKLLFSNISTLGHPVSIPQKPQYNSQICTSTNSWNMLLQQQSVSAICNQIYTAFWNTSFLQYQVLMVFQGPKQVIL